MKFVPLVYDSSGELGAGCGTLRCSVRGNKTLVDNPPKRGHVLGFGVKKVLEKSSGVQRLWIGVRFPPPSPRSVTQSRGLEGSKILKRREG